MPEESAGERTEEATARRREKERERGRVPRSQDLGAATILLTGMVFLRLAGMQIYRWLFLSMQRTISQDMGLLAAPHGPKAAKEIMPYVYTWLQYTAYAVLPFLAAVFIAALVVGVVQAGFMISFEPLTPNLNKLNPISGLKRIFGLRGVVTLTMNLIKLAVVMSVAWATLSATIPYASGAAKLMPREILAWGAGEVITMGLRLAIVLFILALADYAYQRYQHSQDLRMTKQEVKEEMKEMDGDPHMRARRRQIQRQMAMQRMMQEVPDAEVVVRNPTHYAVAIRYKPDMNAPVIVAKGVDKVALRIIDMAIKAGVPCWQMPPLARELYKVEIGHTVPEDLFPAVAEVLAHVLKGDKRAAYENGAARLAS